MFLVTTEKEVTPFPIWVGGSFLLLVSHEVADAVHLVHLLQTHVVSSALARFAHLQLCFSMAHCSSSPFRLFSSSVFRRGSHIVLAGTTIRGRVSILLRPICMGKTCHRWDRSRPQEFLESYCLISISISFGSWVSHMSMNR